MTVHVLLENGREETVVDGVFASRESANSRIVDLTNEAQAEGKTVMGVDSQYDWDVSFTTIEEMELQP